MSGNYATVINENGAATSVSIYPNQSTRTTVMIDFGNCIPAYNTEGYEFHINLQWRY